MHFDAIQYPELQPNREFSCTALSRMIYIDSDLRVLPCPLLNDPSLLLGTVDPDDETSLLRIMEGAACSRLKTTKDTSWRAFSSTLPIFKCPAFYHQEVDGARAN